MIDATLQALSDPTRRQVVELLGRRPHRAGDLAEAVSMSRPAMTRHLRVLRESGLARESVDPDDGRARLYTLDPAPIVELRDWLGEVSAFWTGQLDAFAEHLATRVADDAPAPLQDDADAP